MLDGCCITNTGVISLAEAYANGALASLEELRLNFNPIGHDGMIALAKVAFAPANPLHVFSFKKVVVKGTSSSRNG